MNHVCSSLVLELKFKFFIVMSTFAVEQSLAMKSLDLKFPPTGLVQKNMYENKYQGKLSKT